MKAKEFELLALLSEECGETVQAIGKIFRHGIDCGWNGVTNRQSLEKEIADLMGVIQLVLAFKNFLDHDNIYDKIKEKFWNGNIDEFLHSFKTRDVLDFGYVVSYEVWDSSESHFCENIVNFKSNSKEYVKARMRDYFDDNYEENVNVLSVETIEEWIKKKTIITEKRKS